jgi:pulcherriminic acid synthase
VDPQPVRRRSHGTDSRGVHHPELRRQTEPLLGKTIIQLDGREHALQRGLLTPSFREGVLKKRFTDLIQDSIDELIGAVAARGEADLVGEVVVHLPVRLMAGLLGLPTSDRDQFRCGTSASFRRRSISRVTRSGGRGTTARDSSMPPAAAITARRQAGTDLISTWRQPGRG